MKSFAIATGARPRVLVLSPWLPYPPHQWGAAMRNYQILRHLLARHQVTLLAYGGAGQDRKISALAALGMSVRVVPAPPALIGRKRAPQAASLLSPNSFEVGRVRSASMQEAIDHTLRSAAYDAILVEFSQMAAGFRFAAGPTLIVDQHNIEFELHRRLIEVEPGLARKAFNWIEFVKLRREEQRLWNRFDACLVTSDREAAIVHQMAPRIRTAVVRNGVDLEYLQAFEPLARDPNAIVFTGQMAYRPNADAAVFFATQVLPLIRQRHRATFYVVGQDPPPAVRRLSGADVVVTGVVEDVRPYLSTAAAVVVPVRAGSGTRLKILEALAMGKGVVSTSLGCEGLPLEGERHLLIADEARRFADQVLRLLDDPGLANRLGGAGRALVEGMYAWPATIRPLDEIISSLTSAASATKQRDLRRTRISSG